MSDPIEHLRWHEWARDAWTEKRPPRKPMTSDEKLKWLGEYCEDFHPEGQHYVIVDCLGQKTFEMDFNEALEIAIARFFAVA